MLEWLGANILPIVIGIIPSLVGSYLFLRWQRWQKNKPLSQILNFRSEKLIFIFPHRDPEPKAILPRAATEDFLAVNNFISALLKIGEEKQIIAKDTKHVREADRNANLVIICSPKSNTFSKELQETLLKKGYDKIYRFEPIQGTPNRWRIADEIGQYPSPSYDQMETFKEQEIPDKLIPQQRFEDVAVINKVINPWDPGSYIFIVAGIRGFGTWGAAECLKRKWKDIYNHPNLKDKTGEFSALLHITYQDFDIVQIEVHNVKQPLRKS